MQAIVLLLICLTSVLAQQWDTLYDTSFQVNPGDFLIRKTNGVTQSPTTPFLAQGGCRIAPGAPLLPVVGPLRFYESLTLELPTTARYTRIGVSGRIWAMDNWRGQFVSLSVNDNTRPSWSQSFTELSLGTDLCPASLDGFRDQSLDFGFVIDVNSLTAADGKSLKLTFSSNLLPPLVSGQIPTWGLGKLKVTVFRPPAQSPSPALYQQLLATNFDNAQNPDGFFANPGYVIRYLRCSGDNVIGRLGKGGRLSWSKNYGTTRWRQVRITFRFAYLDGWQDDRAIMFVNGVPVWESAVKTSSTAVACTGTSGVGDRVETVALNLQLRDANSISITFATTLNGALTDESFGISSVNIRAIGAGRFAAVGEEAANAQDSANEDTKAAGLAPLHIGLIVAGVVVAVIVVVVVLVVVRNRQGSIADLDNQYKLQEDE